MIFSTTDPLSRNIKLKKTTWEYKICNFHQTNNNNQYGNSHPEMQSRLSEVQKSVERPHYIVQDTKPEIDENGNIIEVENESRQEYIRFYFEDNVLKTIKTIVEFDESNNGDIVTTHKITKKMRDVKIGGGRIIYDSTE